MQSLFKLFGLFPRKVVISDVLSLRKYRKLREEAQRQLELERIEAKKELEEAIMVPMAMYRKRVDSAHADFMRVEEELWQQHQRRLSHGKTNKVQYGESK